MKAKRIPDPIERMMWVLGYWAMRAERIIKEAGGMENAAWLQDGEAKKMLMECFAQMQEPARICAPYYRPRLQSTTVKVDITAMMAKMHDNDLGQLERLAAVFGEAGRAITDQTGEDAPTH